MTTRQKTVRVDNSVWQTRGTAPTFQPSNPSGQDALSLCGPAISMFHPLGAARSAVEPMVRLFDASVDDVWAAVPTCIEAIGREVESSDLANGEVVFCSGMPGSFSGERYVILVAPLGSQIRVSVSGTQRSKFGKVCEVRIAKTSNQFLTAMSAELT